jgi:hypothetical protein
MILGVRLVTLTIVVPAEPGSEYAFWQYRQNMRTRIDEDSEGDAMATNSVAGQTGPHTRRLASFS